MGFRGPFILEVNLYYLCPETTYLVSPLYMLVSIKPRNAEWSAM